MARVALHFWEEPPISGTKGSGTVFFTGCSLGCIFCQNQEISRGENRGKSLSPQELSDLFFELVEQGAHNINLVTPTHFAVEIAKALRLQKLPVPVVYNCGGYESPETLAQLKGLVDIYLPDFKYADNDLAARLSAASDYREVALAAVAEMRAQQPENIFDAAGILQKGVIIRHLILPLHTKNSIAVLNLIKNQFPTTPVSLMAQYTPVGEKIQKYPELCRPITKRELQKVTDEMLRLNLDGYIQSRKSVGESFIPDFNQFKALNERN
ncbi:MAG: radical SAM protein [Oscillospiraceae bacterium]